MKRKIIFHYFTSFIIACSVIFMTNAIYMRTSIYNEGALYNYNPEENIENFKKYIYTDNSGKVLVSKEGIELLKKDNIGIQIIDEENNEVYSYNKPDNVPLHYTNVSLIDTYTKEEATLYLNEKTVDNKKYTYLMYLDSSKINRVTYSYDVLLLKKAHKFPLLILMNIVLILILSVLFTIKITKPINRIVEKIESLYKGSYSKEDIKKGIYIEVEEKLNKLSERLSDNEKEREKLDKMREEWISNITHDINTPLTSIIGNAEIIAYTDYDVEGEKRINYCNKIINKCEYIKNLVEDLNLSTRLKNNTLILKKSKINIVSLVRHVLIDIINDEKYNHQNIIYNYSDEEIYLDIDEQLMKRVIVNLITNSYIHNDKNIKITIKIDKPTDKVVRILIVDNGKGVSEEELKCIFQRYYRGTSTRRKIEGSGLGLAIAHDIIIAHKASISAESKLESGLIISIVFKNE